MGLKNAAEKVWGFFGLKDGDFEFDDEMSENMDTQKKSTKEFGKVTNFNSIINKNNSNFCGDTKMRIVKPVVYSDVLNICEDLKDRKIILINTTSLEGKIANRMLDFLCGASYVLNAELQEIERGIYVFVPFNIELTSKNNEEEDSKKTILEWDNE